MKNEFCGKAAYFRQLTIQEVRRLRTQDEKFVYISVDSPAILCISQCKVGVVVKTFGAFYICEKIKVENFNRKNVTKIVFKEGDKIICFAQL